MQNDSKNYNPYAGESSFFSNIFGGAKEIVSDTLETTSQNIIYGDDSHSSQVSEIATSEVTNFVVKDNKRPSTRVKKTFDVISNTSSKIFYRTIFASLVAVFIVGVVMMILKFTKIKIVKGVLNG